MASNFTHVFDGDEITAANFNAWLNAATDSAISSVITGASSNTANFASDAASASTATYAIDAARASDATTASSATTAAFATDAASASTSTFAQNAFPTSTGVVGAVGSVGTIAATMLNDATSASSWTADGLYQTSSFGVNTTNSRDGTNSVYAILVVSDSSTSLQEGIFYCDLPGDNSRGSYTHIAGWGWWGKNGNSQPLWEAPEIFDFVVSDATGLRGNNVKVPYPISSTGTWTEFAISITSLNTVRSFGMKIKDSAKGAQDTARGTFRFDDIRFRALGQVQNELKANSHALVPADFSPDTASLGTIFTGWSDMRAEDKPVFDLGIARRNQVTLEEMGIDTTGATDVTAALTDLFEKLPDNTYLTCERGLYGRIRLDNTCVVTGRSLHMDLGGAAFTVGTDDSTVPMLLTRNLEDSILENFRMYGFRTQDDTGDGMTDVSGSAINGTARELDAQDDEAMLPITSGNPIHWYSARDPDGYVRVDFNLSDSAQVENDCLLVAYDTLNDEELHREVLTLTGTETTYSCRFLLTNLRSRIKWSVRKASGTANTITIHSYRAFGQAVYRASQDAASGLDIDNFTRNVIIRNFVAEGCNADAFNVSTGRYKIRDILIENFFSRACGRQGISINSGDRLTIRNGYIQGCGRHSIDIEPTGDFTVNDMVLEHLILEDGFIGHLVGNGWHRIYRPVYNDITIRSSVPGNSGFNVAIGGTDARITSVNVMRDETTVKISDGGGSVQADFNVQGRNVFIDNCMADVGFKFNDATETIGSEEFQTGNYNIGRLYVRRPSRYATLVAPQQRAIVQGLAGMGYNDTPTLGRNLALPRAFGATALRNTAEFTGLNFGFHQHHWPNSYKGPMHSGVYVPGGMNLRTEPLLGVSGLAGQESWHTLLASTSTTVAGTGSAVEVGAYNHLQATVECSAIDSAQSLAFTLEVSPDGSGNWRTLDDWWWFSEATARGTMKVQLASEPYVRIAWTPSSGTVDMRAWGRSWVPPHNLAGEQAVATSATSARVTFPSREYPTLNDFSLAAVSGSGSLTSGTAYYYRVAARPREGGPLVPLSEKSRVAGAGGTIQLKIDYNIDNHQLLEQGPITIYRGTSAGTYDTRFDVFPRDRFTGAPTIDHIFLDSGNTITFTEQLGNDPYAWGWAADAATAQTGGWGIEDETGWEVDTNYRVMVTPTWDSTAYVSETERSGFTVFFGTAPGSAQTIDWFLVRGG